jgi:GT2 family glycosyltransferase
MSSLCLAVLNYNGTEHLRVLLPTALAACRESPVPASVLVLDNCSTSGDVAWVKGQFPEVRVALSPKNAFLHAYNWLLPQLSEDIVMLLNNDLTIGKGSIAPLLRHFVHSDVFSVSASSCDWGGSRITSGPARLGFQNGFYSWVIEKERQELSHTLFTSGGFMAVDRKKFLELSGFNALLYPAYCEDLDLCFRAWRRGWRCIYEPTSVVNHREHGSWSNGKMGHPERLNLRNSLLFQWSTLPMTRARGARAKTTLKCMLRGLLRGDATWMDVWCTTLVHWLRVRRRYAHLKVSKSELAAIQSWISRPCDYFELSALKVGSGRAQD